jgi:hypothetical protein
MARWLATVCVVLGFSPAIAADRGETLLAAKIEYLKQTDAARTAYLQAVDREAERLDAAGDAEQALGLRHHHGALLLGDISAEEYRKFETEGLSPEHLATVDAYISACAECRQTLAGVYQQIADAAEFIKATEEAETYRAELESFQEGDYIPTTVEVIKPRPFEVRRVQLDPPTILPATAARIPDELSVEFRDPSFVIYGTRSGSGRGDVGKGVIVTIPPNRKKLRGYLMIGASAKRGTYSIFTANKSKLTPVVELEDLELDTVYEWTMELVRNDYRFQVLQAGEIVKTGKALGGPGYVFGFCATLRDEDSEARLVVAVDSATGE